MAKNVDYSKIKALAASILECIGDTSEGENPSIPKQTQDTNDGGQDSLDPIIGSEEGGTDEPNESSKDETAEGYADSPDEKKKKKDASLAMMGSMLASKLK